MNVKQSEGLTVNNIMGNNVKNNSTNKSYAAITTAQSYKNTANNIFFDFGGSKTSNIDSLRDFRQKMRDKISKESSSRKNHSLHNYFN